MVHKQPSEGVATRVPQADKLERVLEYAVLTAHAEFPLRDLLFQGRDAQYYRAAACVLDLLDDAGAATEHLRGFLGGAMNAMGFLRERFAESDIGVEWARWAHSSLWDVDPATAEPFLRECSGLGASTSARRAKSLASWLSLLRYETTTASLPTAADAGDEGGEGRAVEPAMQAPHARDIGRDVLGGGGGDAANLGQNTGVIRTLPVARPPAPPAPVSVHGAPSEPAGLPTIAALGIPRDARSLFGRLLHEQVGDWDALILRCVGHTDEFVARTIRNEFLPLNDARRVLATFQALVGRVREGDDPIAKTLVWVVGRYFEIADDGEMDFAISGLDDDIAVCNAVSRHLGFPELIIEFD